MNPKLKRQKRIVRHRRVRAKVFGTKERPRLSVFRSHKHIHLQLIDDTRGKTLVAASTLEIRKPKAKQEQTAAVAKLLAERAFEGGIREVVFDRGGYKFHGRVKLVAQVVQAAGLKI